ncbi:MAG: thiamine pyridinylase [Bacteroidota bacterium]
MSFRLFNLLLVTWVIVGCSSLKKSTDSSSASSVDNISELNVALYPYLFEGYEKKSQSILTEMWKAKHPTVRLNFTDYNSYKTPPPANVDVFVMDALYLSSFAEKKWILPIDKASIKDKKDILPHSLAGCLYNGQYFGIPQFGCANILYYRKQDQDIRDSNTLEDLYRILGQANYQSQKPPKDTSLLIDLSSGTSNICWYLEAVMDQSGEYSTSPKLTSPDSLDKQSLENVKKLVAMGGQKQSRKWYPQRAEWFSDGDGRAYVGFTENMFQMKPTHLVDMSMKLIPSFNDSDVDLFFMDAAVINAQVGSSPRKIELAIDLMNLITSTAHMVRSCQNGDNAFYYMPARESIFQQLEQQYPKYSDMRKLIHSSIPKTFRLGKDAFEKINSDYKDQMEAKIFD